MRCKQPQGGRAASQCVTNPVYSRYAIGYCSVSSYGTITDSRRGKPLRLFLCGGSPLTTVIPTKRSAWRDLRTIVKNTVKSMGRSLDCARDDSSVIEPTASRKKGSGQILGIIVNC